MNKYCVRIIGTTQGKTNMSTLVSTCAENEYMAAVNAYGYAVDVLEMYNPVIEAVVKVVE